MRQRARERIGQKFLGDNWKERIKQLEPTMADRVRAAQQSNWLTPDEVREIRKRVEAGENYNVIAPDFDRTPTSIARIAKGETYTHVPGAAKSTPGRGEDNVGAKLTAERVRQARERRQWGVAYQRLADDYGVSRRTIERAVTGETWSHI